jgi:hypothetical protein
MVNPKKVALDFGFGTVTGEGRWAGELAGRCGSDDICGHCNVFPFNVFVLWFAFRVYLDVFVEVCEAAAERARKGRGVLLQERAYTFVVESVGTRCDEEGLTDRDRKET